MTQGGTRARVAIVGGTGYTGAELIRLLSAHPGVELAQVTSRAEYGRPLGDFFPHLAGRCDLHFTLPETAALAACDVVFFAAPNGVAMEQVPELLAAGVRVIDLSADFRLRDAALWERWYGKPHACPELLDEAVYGLPELHRDAVKGARLVANPGCYPTAIVLGLLPLVEAGAIEAGRVIADAKSGVSGAGRTQRPDLLFCEANQNLRAYGVFAHRHQPEIEQVLHRTGHPVDLVFVPHLIPMSRGILATLHVRLVDETLAVQAVYETRYADAPFVRVEPPGSHPQTRQVSGTNDCRIAVHSDGRRVVVLSVIDNLVKGAAGQAIQNMNLILALPETLGLDGWALLP